MLLKTTKNSKILLQKKPAVQNLQAFFLISYLDYRRQSQMISNGKKLFAKVILNNFN